MRWGVPVGAAVVGGAIVALLVAATTPEPATQAQGERVEVAAVSIPAAASVGEPLVAASFNVCKVDCAAPAPSWDVRRDRVARIIAESGADVIGIQEATNNPTSTAKTQADDVASLAAPVGYRTPAFPIEANECRRPRDASGQLAGPSPCDNTAILLYRSPRVQQVTLPNGQPSAGIVQASTIAPGLDPLSGMRSVAWAYLETDATGPFLAVSAHTDSAKTPEAEASRVAFANAMGPWAEQWNAAHGMSGTPVVLMADLNSYAKRQPNGAQKALTDAGWTDAATAPVKRNTQYSTINYNPLLGVNEQGFPTRPYEFRTTRKKPVLDATRIDYVMAKGGNVVPADYEVVMRLNPDGTFDPNYQASDHQMVRSTLLFPSPTLAIG